MLPPLCHFFVYVLLLTPMFALGTVKSPVFFLWYTTGTISIKEQPKEGLGVVFCQESHIILEEICCKKQFIGLQRRADYVNLHNLG